MSRSNVENDHGETNEPAEAYDATQQSFQLPEDREEQTVRTSTNADPKDYAFVLGDRVKSFGSDPLHSAAYLAYLVKYLKTPYQKQHKRQRLQQRQSSDGLQRPFVRRYLLEAGQMPGATPFDKPDAFAAVSPPDGNELVFLTGRPSAEWLNCIGSKYKLDYRFFHQHLGTLLPGQRHWYAVPGLPSRSLQVVQLHIPTLVFVGAEGRNLDIPGLELAREDCNDQIRREMRLIQDCAYPEAGKSIIRRVEIYDGRSLVTEQQLTITIVRRDEHWTLLIWSDAGNEEDYSHIPVPSTEHFKPVANQTTFCPVFFENERNHLQQDHSTGTQDVGSARISQPIVLLNSRYGETLDWRSCEAPSPLFALQELLVFNASAVLQYLNMLEQVLSEAGRCPSPSYENTKLETMLHYDYIKIALSRLEQGLVDVQAFLKDPPAKWRPDSSTPGPGDLPKTWPLLIEDFDYVRLRTRKLFGICEDGKSTLMGNASIQEAARFAKESKLVTELTKATNRLTFIFLPISFVTSVFGMNFSQFGQGKLSIWIWVVITVPLLVVSIILVERGKWIQQSSKRVISKLCIKKNWRSRGRFTS